MKAKVWCIHYYQKQGHFAVKDDNLVVHLLYLNKQKIKSSCFKRISWNVRLPWARGPAIRADVVLHQRFNRLSLPAVALSHTHHTYMFQYSYLHTTDVQPCLFTMMVIFREQQANVGQWINTSLTPDPPKCTVHWRPIVIFPQHDFLCSLTFRRSATFSPPPCSVCQKRNASHSRLSHTRLPLSKQFRVFYKGTHCAVSVHFL